MERFSNLSLIIFLILSIFFRTFWKLPFSRNFPLTTTNVQKVWSIMTFSLSVVDFPPIKSKVHIFLHSCCVWVKGSKRLTSSSRVILHTRSWYVKYFSKIWIKSSKISMIFKKISWWLSLSEDTQASYLHQSLWLNNVVFHIQTFMSPEDVVPEEFVFFYTCRPFKKISISIEEYNVLPWLWS